MTIHKRTSSRLLAFAICLLFISPAVGATELEAKDGDVINANDRREREDKTSKLKNKPLFSPNQANINNQRPKETSNPRLRRKSSSSSHQGNVNHRAPKEGKHQKKTSKEKRPRGGNTGEQRPISSLKRPGHAPVFTEIEEMALRLVMKRKKVQRLRREELAWFWRWLCVMVASIFGAISSIVRHDAMLRVYNKGAKSRRCRQDFEDHELFDVVSLIGSLVGMGVGFVAYVYGLRRGADCREVEREIMSIKQRYGASIDNDPKALWLLENFE